MGSASQPMLVVKFNRAQLKKRSIKQLKDLVRKTSGKTELEFKQITTEEMALIKKRIRVERRKNARHELMLYLISGVITILIKGHDNLRGLFLRLSMMNLYKFSFL